MTNENGAKNSVTILIEPFHDGYLVEVFFYDEKGNRYPASVSTSIDTLPEAADFIVRHTTEWYSSPVISK